MKNVIQLSVQKKQESVDSYRLRIRATDTAQRVRATKDAAREAWHMIFWPFGVLGLIFLGWRGAVIGCAIGMIFYIIILDIVRYGSEL